MPFIIMKRWPRHYKVLPICFLSLGGDPKDTYNIEKAVNLLQEAKKAEADGLQALKKLREALGTLQLEAFNESYPSFII